MFPQAATKVSGPEWSDCAKKGLAVKTRKGDALLFFRWRAPPSPSHIEIAKQRWAVTALAAAAPLLHLSESSGRLGPKALVRAPTAARSRTRLVGVRQHAAASHEASALVGLHADARMSLACLQPEAGRAGGPCEPARLLPDHTRRKVERDQVDAHGRVRPLGAAAARQMVRVVAV